MNRKKGLRIFAIILIVLAFLLEGIYHFKLEPADRDGRTNDTVAEEQSKEKTTEEEPTSSSEKKQEQLLAEPAEAFQQRRPSPASHPDMLYSRETSFAYHTSS